MGGAIHEAGRHNVLASANRCCIRLIQADSFERNKFRSGFGLRSVSGNSGAQAERRLERSRSATPPPSRRRKPAADAANTRYRSVTRERRQNFLTEFWCRADEPANYFASMLVVWSNFSVAACNR
jgi:hypothetical protein